MNMNVGPELVRLLFNYSQNEFFNEDFDEIEVSQEELGSLGDLGYSICDKFKETQKYLDFAQKRGFTDIDVGGFVVEFNTGNFAKVIVDVTLFKTYSETSEAMLLVSIDENGSICSIEFRNQFSKHELYFVLSF